MVAFHWLSGFKYFLFSTILGDDDYLIDKHTLRRALAFNQLECQPLGFEPTCMASAGCELEPQPAGKAS